MCSRSSYFIVNYLPLPHGDGLRSPTADDEVGQVVLSLAGIEAVPLNFPVLLEVLVQLRDRMSGPTELPHPLGGQQGLKRVAASARSVSSVGVASSVAPHPLHIGGGNWRRPGRCCGSWSCPLGGGWRGTRAAVARCCLWFFLHSWSHLKFSTFFC